MRTISSLPQDPNTNVTIKAVKLLTDSIVDAHRVTLSTTAQHPAKVIRNFCHAYGACQTGLYILKDVSKNLSASSLDSFIQYASKFNEAYEKNIANIVTTKGRDCAMDCSEGLSTIRLFSAQLFNIMPHVLVAREAIEDGSETMDNVTEADFRALTLYCDGFAHNLMRNVYLESKISDIYFMKRALEVLETFARPFNNAGEPDDEVSDDEDEPGSLTSRERWIESTQFLGRNMPKLSATFDDLMVVVSQTQGAQSGADLVNAFAGMEL